MYVCNVTMYGMLCMRVVFCVHVLLVYDCYDIGVCVMYICDVCVYVCTYGKHVSCVCEMLRLNAMICYVM